MDQQLVRRIIREELEIGFRFQSSAFSNQVREQIIRCEEPRLLIIVLQAAKALERHRAICLEIGTGFGSMVRTLARVFPGTIWHTVDHPGQPYTGQPAFLESLNAIGCSLQLCDFMNARLPYADDFFSYISFSEVLEHLPIAGVLPLMKDISRVLKRNGLISISSPNQAALMNRIQLLRGKSILSLPTTLEYAGGVYGHVRLYTMEEIKNLASMVGWEVIDLDCRSRNWPQLRSESLMKSLAYSVLKGIDKVASLVTNELGDTWYALCRKQ